MDIKDIHNYKYTKNNFVKLHSGKSFRVTSVDFADKHQPIETRENGWLISEHIEELFEKTKPTIAELPFGTKFKYLHTGGKYMSVNGANLTRDGLKVFAVGLEDNKHLNNPFVAGKSDFELID